MSTHPHSDPKQNGVLPDSSPPIKNKSRGGASWSRKKTPQHTLEILVEIRAGLGLLEGGPTQQWGAWHKMRAYGTTQEGFYSSTAL